MFPPSYPNANLNRLPQLYPKRFSDVPQGHWANWAVNNMANAGVLVGYPDGKYHGDEPTNRYQLAAVLNQFTTLADQGKLPIASRSELNALNERLTRLEQRFMPPQAMPRQQWIG